MNTDRWVLYSSAACTDCPPAIEKLDDANVRYAKIDIMETLGGLKRFLALRDAHSEFDTVRETGSIGIPVLVKNDGEAFIFDIVNMEMDEMPVRDRRRS